MDASFEYVFPAIRGIQAKREYYVSMCPLRLLPKVFLFNEEELVPHLRAQRALNKARLPEMTRYILDGREEYVFSAITASIDGDVRFVSLGEEGNAQRIGSLHIPMDAKFIINDGQHRRAAIESALRENPELADESIAVVFFIDKGLERCQQMFADLNRHAVRASRSIGVLYDHRDALSRIARRAVLDSSAFRDLVELERSTLSARSRKLVTLSAIYAATKALLAGMEDRPYAEREGRAQEFWEEVAKQFKEWQLVREGQIAAGEVRRDFLHSHGIVLHALGVAGNALLCDGPNWKAKLRKLRSIDWRRANAETWEGRAMIGGRVQKSEQNVVLTSSFIKKHLGLALTEEENRAEAALARSRHG